MALGVAPQHRRLHAGERRVVFHDGRIRGQRDGQAGVEHRAHRIGARQQASGKYCRKLRPSAWTKTVCGAAITPSRAARASWPASGRPKCSMRCPGRRGPSASNARSTCSIAASPMACVARRHPASSTSRKRATSSSSAKRRTPRDVGVTVGQAERGGRAAQAAVGEELHRVEAQPVRVHRAAGSGNGPPPSITPTPSR